MMKVQERKGADFFHPIYGVRTDIPPKVVCAPFGDSCGGHCLSCDSQQGKLHFPYGAVPAPTLLCTLRSDKSQKAAFICPQSLRVPSGSLSVECR